MYRATLLVLALLLATAGTATAQGAAAQDAKVAQQDLCLLPATALPIFVFHEDGTLSLERMPEPTLKRTTVGVSSTNTTVIGTITPQAVACNGQTVDCGGDKLTCPSSGGPTCGDNETCECRCDKTDFAAYNACVRG